jgi:hypothetical protein
MQCVGAATTCWQIQKGITSVSAEDRTRLKWSESQSFRAKSALPPGVSMAAENAVISEN